MNSNHSEIFENSASLVASRS